MARAAPFTVLSTGTWVIAMAAGAGIDQLDPATDMLANVDALGQPVPTARFMGGREVELVAGADALQAAATAEDVAAILAADVMALPSFVAGSGPFIGRRADRGRSRGAPARRAALAALYAALTIARMLENLGFDRPGDRRGQLSPQRRLLRPLASLRPGQTIHATDDPSVTARGAWLLARWDERPTWPNTLAAPVPGWQIAGLTAYAARWSHLSDGTNPA